MIDLRDAALATAGLTLTALSTRGYFANETLQVGCIGTGGRCRILMKQLATRCPAWCGEPGPQE
jgi:hypothetical protein